MKRREFITLLGGAAARGRSRRAAQQGEQMPRVGVLASDRANPITEKVCQLTRRTA